MEDLIAFDSEKYIELQTQKILERTRMFENKLFIECGGKLYADNHASRVLPGFMPDLKLNVFKNMSDNVEVLYCVNSEDIKDKKVRGDSSLTYDQEAIQLIMKLEEAGLPVNNVALTKYTGQVEADAFAEELTKLGKRVTFHPYIKDYPSDIDKMFGSNGLEQDPYIHTTKPIVIVNGPGTNSGKFRIAIGQLYHEHQNGVKAGYAKYETFPAWDLGVSHPVNLAYEAATADIDDKVAIDTYHMEQYGEAVTSFNRDMETFPLLREVFIRGIGKSPYASPTDMGINSVGECIMDDEWVRAAAIEEIIRRYNRYKDDDELSYKIKQIAERAGIDTETTLEDLEK